MTTRCALQRVNFDEAEFVRRWVWPIFTIEEEGKTAFHPIDDFGKGVLVGVGRSSRKGQRKEGLASPKRHGNFRALGHRSGGSWLAGAAYRKPDGGEAKSSAYITDDHGTQISQGKPEKNQGRTRGGEAGMSVEGGREQRFKKGKPKLVRQLRTWGWEGGREKRKKRFRKSVVVRWGTFFHQKKECRSVDDHGSKKKVIKAPPPHPSLGAGSVGKKERVSGFRGRERRKKRVAPRLTWHKVRTVYFIGERKGQRRGPRFMGTWAEHHLV